MKLKKYVFETCDGGFPWAKARFSPRAFFFLLHPWSLGSCLASLVYPVFTPFPLKYKYYLGLKRELGGKLQYAPAPSFLSHRQGVFPGQQQPSESL